MEEVSVQVEKEWEAHGTECAVVPNRAIGHRCGYVRIPEGHPWFGKDYRDTIEGAALDLDRPAQSDYIELFLYASDPDKDKKPPALVMLISVHGALTFTGRRYWSMERPGADTEWWFGFDCGHSDDARDPELLSESAKPLYASGGILESIGHHGHVWKLHEVASECELLALQVKNQRGAFQLEAP